ncbi:hypothetical protein BDW02DRAFT_175848 [Decorospora gaudefroyi]|uniref:Uncharacterized protein n=1 Tax=Decorospora gaudefroyi TaxID=184978 RepID=A0A6A5K4N6_9PLEO|nr:hypothetical protein BDW02DRAFT_175848 [Decorospora gaudefroyi]
MFNRTHISPRQTSYPLHRRPQPHGLERPHASESADDSMILGTPCSIHAGIWYVGRRFATLARWSVSQLPSTAEVAQRDQLLCMRTIIRSGSVGAVCPMRCSCIPLAYEALPLLSSQGTSCILSSCLSCGVVPGGEYANRAVSFLCLFSFFYIDLDSSVLSRRCSVR